MKLRFHVRLSNRSGGRKHTRHSQTCGRGTCEQVPILYVSWPINESRYQAGSLGGSSPYIPKSSFHSSVKVYPSKGRLSSPVCSQPHSTRR